MKYSNNIKHYANSLYFIWNEFTSEHDKVVYTDAIKAVYFAIKKNHHIIDLLGPQSLIEKDTKFKILNNIFSDFDDKNNLALLYVYNFLSLLLENHFFDKILEIIIVYFELLDETLNFMFIRVYSPFRLDVAVLKRIENIFVSKIDNRKIRYENIIDHSLIGGIKIIFGNNIYDYSIKGKIEQIKLNLKNDKYNQ